MQSKEGTHIKPVIKTLKAEVPREKGSLSFYHSLV